MFRHSMKVVLLLALIAMLVITGCSSKSPDGVIDDEFDGAVADKLTVVTSFYPLYDFANKIGGEHVHVVNLIPAGVDPHDWAPKLQQMAMIVDADVFIYNGLGFEGWVDDVLDGLKDGEALTSIEASHGVNAIAGHHHDQHDNHQHHHRGVDPHIWLSPLQAKIMADNIKNGFIAADPEHQADYETNVERLLMALDELHEQYTAVINSMPKDTLIVSHEAFGYVARDYNLQQMGILGLSSSSEPTIDLMRQIIDFIKDHDVQYILFEELTSPKLAQTLANDIGIDILNFNTLEGLKEEQIAAGEDYFSIMEQNLKSIEKALQ